MIRAVTLQDTSAITAIYNEYIAHSTSTFDIEPVSEEEMQKESLKFQRDIRILYTKQTEKLWDIATHIRGKNGKPTTAHLKRLYICRLPIREKDWAGCSCSV